MLGVENGVATMKGMREEGREGGGESRGLNMPSGCCHFCAPDLWDPLPDSSLFTDGLGVLSLPGTGFRNGSSATCHTA